MGNFQKAETSMDSRMESLMDELIMDILSRVPILDLLKLRYVCKRWNNIVKDPLFHRLHRSHCMPNLNENRVLILKRSSKLYMVDIADKTKPREIEFDLPLAPCLFNYEFVGSCNGLLCLGSQRHQSIFIINPFTRRLMFFYMNLKVDRELVWSWGFGFDEINKSFKVVTLVHTKGNYDELQVTVCELGSDGSTNWRNNIGVTTFVNDRPAYFFNGRLHWTNCNGRRDNIISFDLADEVSRPIQIPDHLRGIISFDLLVLGGCLCIFYSLGSQLKIWAMKEYGIKASWAKLLDAQLHVNIFPHIDHGRRFFRGLGSVKDGELVVLEWNTTACEGAILFSDSVCDELKHLQLGGPLYPHDLIIHTVTLNWI